MYYGSFYSCYCNLIILYCIIAEKLLEYIGLQFVEGKYDLPLDNDAGVWTGGWSDSLQEETTTMLTRQPAGTVFSDTWNLKYTVTKIWDTKLYLNKIRFVLYLTCVRNHIWKKKVFPRHLAFSIELR